MTSNFKAMGLALVAVFAMSAVVASTASAQVGNLGKITSDGAVTLKGTETGGVGQNKFVTFGNTKECPGSTYTGHKVNVTPHEPIANNANEATITPTYINCVDQNGRKITIDMNGCDYVFKDVTTKTANANTYTVLTDIVCPPNKEITATGGFCTVHVPAQINKAGFHLVNTGMGTADDLDLTGTISTLTETACGFLHTTTGQWTLDVTFKGFNGATETGVTVSD